MANTFKFGNGNWAVKDGYALAYNDENNNFKPLPFDFTRASSATTLNRQGLIETVPSGKPRIDFLDNTSGHLLLEPSRTNNLQRSEEFENSYWINNGVTITANQTISPDGSQNSDLLTGVSGGFGVIKFSTWTSTNKVASCFAKKGSSNLFKISNASLSYIGVTFDLENGTITNEDSGFEGEIENYGNGWFRCTAIDTSARSGTFSLGVTTATASVYIWGAQLEAGSYATSYIPTSGSTETRQAEICNGSGNSETFNDSEGVLFLEVEALADDGTTRVITVNNSSNQLTERVQVFILGSSLYARVTDGGVTQGQVIDAPTLTDNNKVAFKFKKNDFALWVNGIETDTSALGTTPSGLNEIRFDAGTGGSPFYGKVKELTVINEALTDEQLQLLTTP